jgi:hypothetical protein
MLDPSSEAAQEIDDAVELIKDPATTRQEAIALAAAIAECFVQARETHVLQEIQLWLPKS